MRFISLFSGIGGFDLGFERAGMECVAQVEIDEKARKVLAKHFPDVPRFEDVKEFDYGKPVDLIAGGFPCQDVSVAGRRAGLAGARSGLWYEFHRIIASIRPRWVVIENVPGLLSSNEGKDFAVILRGLVECGYGVVWRILDAQYFGVPQRRRRVFIIGSLGNGCAIEILFEREGVPGNTPPSREAGKDVAFSLRSNPSHSGDKGDGGINTTMIPEIVGSLDTGGASGKNSHGGAWPGTTVQSISAGHAFAFMPRKTQMDVYEDVSPTMHAGGGGKGAPAVALGLNSRNNRFDAESQSLIAYNIQHNDGGNHRRKDRPNGGLYINETETALTVGTTDLTAIQQALGVRRLTPTECERLQGFPDGWTAGQADTTRYRQLGNAVAVPVVEWIGRRIMVVTA